MYLQLADPPQAKPGYTYLPYTDSPNSKGAYVRNDVLKVAVDSLNDADYALAEQDLAGFFSKIWSGVKKVAKLAQKLGLAIPRNSFLAIVEANVHGFASRLHKLIEKKPDALKNLWEKTLGGDYGKLKAAVGHGAKRKHLFEGEYMGDAHYSLSEMGDPEPLSFAPAAALATAAPIIGAILKLLKKEMPKDPEVQQTVDSVQQAVDQLPAQEKEQVKEQVNKNPASNPEKYETEKGGTGTGGTPEASDKIFGMPKMAVYIGGGVVGLLLLKSLTKK